MRGKSNQNSPDTHREPGDVGDAETAAQTARAGPDLPDMQRAAAVAASLDGLWDWDFASDTLRCSRRGVELLGYGWSDKPLRMEALWTLLCPDDAAALRSAVADCTQRGWPLDVEHRLRTRTGGLRWFRLRGQLSISQSGQSVGLAGVLQDIDDRKRTEAALEDRVRFERLLADLSATFVHLPAEQLDAGIESSLSKLVAFLGNDRSTLVKFTPDTEGVWVTHSYAVPACQPFPVGPFAVKQLPWYIAQLRSGKIVFVRDVPDDLPPEATQERDYCVRDGIQSNVAIPLKTSGSVLGAITFAFLTRRCAWPADVITRLQLIGEVFANGLQRQRSDAALQTALAENGRLRSRLELENQYLREQVVLKHQHGRFIGQSDALQKVLAEAERVAVTDTPVLLLGETGTGKELLAEAIHEHSARRDRAMVVVNCASLPATLIESELFGREAGAYTGAASAQVGRFTVADGSTMFLDEIGEFPIELQAKLLRVLQDGRFERLGSPKTVSVNVRIVAATNRDLEQAVHEGKFRADLYHRLNVFPIRVPPLRDRREDIPALVWGFVEILGRRMGKTIKTIPRKTMQQLQQYAWPGNVRELSNVIERAMILATSETLHVEMSRDATPCLPSPSMTLKQREREQIVRVLEATRWRVRGTGGAAEILDIKPTTLEARMARLGIQRPESNSNIS